MYMYNSEHTDPSQILHVWTPYDAVYVHISLHTRPDNERFQLPPCPTWRTQNNTEHNTVYRQNRAFSQRSWQTDRWPNNWQRKRKHGGTTACLWASAGSAHSRNSHIFFSHIDMYIATPDITNTHTRRLLYSLFDVFLAFRCVAIT